MSAMHPVQQKRNGRAILDAKGLMLHSYYGTKDPGSTLRNSDGEQIPGYAVAFEGWLDRYFDLIVETHGFNPIDIVCVWDGGKEYRTTKYPEYKGDRKPFDPVEGAEHTKLRTLIQNFLAAVGSIQVSVPGVEADDLIAYIAPAVKPFANVYTVDNDIVQLANEQVTVFVRDVEKEFVQEKEDCIAVPAKYLALYKSLVGDKSDHYPGVKGFGERKFAGLVRDYGWDGMDELEDYVKNKSVGEFRDLAAEMKDPVIDLIADQVANWKLFYDMAVLHPELCYGFKRKAKVEPTWYKRVPNEIRLSSILEKAGLSYLFEKYRVHCSLEYLMSEGDTVDDVFEEVGANVMAYDYETWDPNPQASLNDANPRGDYVNVLHATPTGASFCFGPNLQYVVYVPVDHKDTFNFPLSTIAEVLKKNPARIAHNNAFEKVVTDLKIEEGVETNLCDTSLLSSHVDENQMSHHLKDLSKKWLGFDQTTYAELMEQAGVSQTNELTGTEILSYGCDDSLVTAHLWVLLDLILMIEGTDEFVYANEFHWTDVMSKGFKRGTPVDLEKLKELEVQDTASLKEKFAQMHSSLAEHCMKVNPTAVVTFMKEITPYLKAKAAELSAKNNTDVGEELAILHAKETAKWRQLSRYNPPTETKETEPFIPT